MNETIAKVEDQIIEALKPLLADQPDGYVKEIDTYQGQLAESTVEEIINVLAVNFPAIMVIYLGSRLNEDPTDLYDDVQSWGIFVAAKNLRGEKEARRGGTIGEVGTYQMVEDIKTRLTGNQLGLGVQPLSLRAVDSVLVDKGLSVYGMTFETSLDYQAERKAGPI